MEKQCTNGCSQEKCQMKAIEGEPLTQTQRREKHVLYTFQTDIELLELRARSHE